jgi:Toxin co-regulated pilus biosynthesis protein Q
MRTYKLSIVAAITALFFISSAPAFAANITCQLNPNTGKIEASQAWKNVLGDEADRACEKAMPSASKQQTLTQISQSKTGGITPEVVATSSLIPTTSKPPFQAPTVAAIPALLPQTQMKTQTNIVASINSWQVELKDVNLSTTFSRWAESAGWRIRWDADKNILVDAPDVFSGSFEDAVTAVLSSDGIQGSSYPLEVCFYSNTPPLARITRKGEQKDCK